MTKELLLSTATTPILASVGDAAAIQVNYVIITVNVVIAMPMFGALSKMLMLQLSIDITIPSL